MQFVQRDFRRYAVQFDVITPQSNQRQLETHLSAESLVTEDLSSMNVFVNGYVNSSMLFIRALCADLDFVEHNKGGRCYWKWLV